MPGLLTQIHPSLETVLGPRLAHPAAVDLLGRYPTPAALQRAGRGHVRTRLNKLAPRIPIRLTDEILAALTGQTTVVSGTRVAEHIIGRLATQLQQLTQQRLDIDTEILSVVDAHPFTDFLISMPGVGIRTPARILTEVVGKDFKSAAHLAAYAGIAPVTGQSGASPRGQAPCRRGNKVLKRVLFLSALASTKDDPASRAYYHKKRVETKRHNQTLIALARRRTDVLFAILRNGTFYESQPAPLTPAA